MAERFSAAIVASLESGFISQALLDPLPRRYFQPVQRYAFVLGSSSALEDMFALYTLELQSSFRAGIIEAMETWQEGKLKPETYRNLIYLAGDTKTLQAIPLIENTIESQKMVLDDDVQCDVLGAAIVTFSHLSSYVDEETQQRNVDLIKKWFSDPYYERFAGTLMNAICHFRPDEFTELFPKFLAVARRNPDFFILNACIQESIRVVTAERMSGYLDKLSSEAKVLVAQQLSNA